jgi:hypothetical protein
MGITSELGQKIKDNFDYLYSQIGSGSGGSVPNGDFEVDGDNDNLPDMWTIQTYSGGSAALDTLTPASGSKCLKFVHPGGAGNGGGFADSDFIPFSFFGWVTVWTYATAACKNHLTIRYFNRDKTFLEEVTVDARTDTPATWVMLIACVSRQNVNATYIKIRLIGGFTDTNVAASIYFDRVSFQTTMPDKLYLEHKFSTSLIPTTSFTDIASMNVVLPIFANTPALYQHAKLVAVVETYNTALTVFLRLRVSAVFGETVEVTAGTWAQCTVELPLVLAPRGIQTLWIQGFRSSGTAYVRKTSGYAYIDIQYQ